MGYYSGLLGFIANQQGLGENQRQFNAQMGENSRQFDNSFLEDRRRFNAGFGEDRRRFNQGFLEDQRRFDNSFLENQRQFDTSTGENARQFNEGMGANYDQMGLQLLSQLFGIDQSMFGRDLATFGANQDAQQRAFANNTGLLGLLPQPQSAPVNASGAYATANQSASQQQAIAAQQQSDMLNTAAQAAMMFAMFSSRGAKDKTGDIDGAEALDAIMALPVDRWKYKGDDREHIGTYAEDFAEAAGIGDGETINVIDYLGVLTAAVQEIARRAA